MYQFLFTKTPLYFFAQSFWRDEAFSYLLALKNVPDILMLSARDFSPPLYYILLHLWMNIFGNSEVAIRSLSFIFFTLTAFVFYEFMVIINKFSHRTSLIYLALFLLNPLLNYYAFEARMYSMLGFFTIFSFYTLYQKKNKLYLLATILGLYTHYFMLFVILVQAIWLYLQHDRKAYIHSLKPLFVSVIAFIPWAIYMLSVKQLSGGFWVPRPQMRDLWYLLSSLYTGYEKGFGQTNNGTYGYTSLVTNLNITIVLLVIATGIYVIKKNVHKDRPLLQLYLLWTLVPPVLVFIVSRFAQSYYLPRYLISSSVGLMLLLCFLLEKVPFKLRVIPLVVLFFLTVQYQQLNILYRKKYSFYRLAKEIESSSHPQDLYYVTDEKDFHTAQYYLGIDRVFIYGKNYEDIPSFVGKVLIPQNKLVYMLPQYPHKAFLINYNGGYRIMSQL